MREAPARLHERAAWHDAGWTRACSVLALLVACDFLELSSCASVAGGSRVEHEGFCPNKLNSNLWVDAQSTCERDCNVDEVRSDQTDSHDEGAGWNHLKLPPMHDS